MKEQRYYFFFCKNGRKNKVVETDIVDRTTFDNFDWFIPLDIIDADEHHIWFDDGDD